MVDDTKNLLESYPGPGHILRHIRLELDCTETSRITASMPVLPDLCTHGTVRLGPVAMLADFAAGVVSLHTTAPDWNTTYDLKVHLTGKVSSGTLVATCDVVRAGRNSVVSETTVSAEDGSEIARATVTFMRLPWREGTPKAAPVAGVLHLRDEVEAERVPLDDLLGFRPDTAGGFVEFDHLPVLHNSVGAIQGGVIAMSMERAAALVAERELGGPARTTDLHLHYLTQGKIGPFQARAERLRGDTTVVSRVALVDTGADDKLLSLGTAHASLV